jgi:hypothetical protein
MLNNGNSVRSSYPLMPFEKIHGVPPDATGDARAFIAFIQKSETNLSIKTTSLVQGDHAQNQSAYMISFPWQGDPRDGVVAVLPARHRNVPEWSLEETTARKDGR